MLAAIQTAVTLVFAPAVCLYLVTIMTDCTANSPHGSYLDFQVCYWHTRSLPQDVATNVRGLGLWLPQFWNMVIMPCMSFIMSCYMLVSYWMDSESWTMLRRCLMFANIPMVVFFGTTIVCHS